MKKIKICLMFIFCLFLTGCGVYTDNEGNVVEKEQILNIDDYYTCVYENQEYVCIFYTQFFIKQTEKDELIEIGYVKYRYFSACKAYKIKGKEDFIISDSETYVKKEYVFPKFEEIEIKKMCLLCESYNYDSDKLYSYEKEIDFKKGLMLKEFLIETTEPPKGERNLICNVILDINGNEDVYCIYPIFNVNGYWFTYDKKSELYYSFDEEYISVFEEFSQEWEDYKKNN